MNPEPDYWPFPTRDPFPPGHPPAEEPDEASAARLGLSGGF